MPSEGADSSKLMIQKYVGHQWGKPYGAVGWETLTKTPDGRFTYTIRLLPTLYERGQSRVIIVDMAGEELAASNPFVLKKRGQKGVQLDPKF